MAGLVIDCPVCEKEIEIPERQLKLAVQHRTTTGGEKLVSCPKCCRVLNVTSGLPDSVLEWNVNLDDVVCVPFLDDTVLRIPAGYKIEGGVTMYRSGAGTLNRKREYMYLYGLDPECYLKK